MTETANSQDRMRATLVIVATLATIGYNALAATGFVNGITPGVISDHFPTNLTPASYAFSIWSLIYLGTIAFSVYQFLPANLLRFRNVRSLYIFSCLLNCGWIYFWHREQIGICLILILALLVALVFLIILFQRSGPAGGSLFTTAPFGIYAGWVSAAAIVNLAIFLNYAPRELSTLTRTILGVSFIVFATALAVIVRLKLKNYFYALAVAWALTAIAVKQGGNTAIVVAAAFCVVICTVTAGSFVVDLRDSTSE